MEQSENDGKKGDSQLYLLQLQAALEGYGTLALDKEVNKAINNKVKLGKSTLLC